jgi:hypothetical protein
VSGPREYRPWTCERSRKEQRCKLEAGLLNEAGKAELRRSRMNELTLTRHLPGE